MTVSLAGVVTSPTTRSSPHVLVVGAGLGGLCLAQGLHKSGIDVSIYERDDSPRVRHQGYRVSLREHGPRALRACLPGDLFDLCVATSIRPATHLAMLDEHLAEKFAKPTGHADTAPDPAEFGVNRLTLRQILLARLTGIIHFGTTFHRYERLPDGQVRAHFTDGSTATGDVLVGADGTNSAVRRQLLPDAGIDEWETAVYGRTPLTVDTRRWLPDTLVGGFTRIMAATPMALTTCQAWEPAASAAARIAPDVELTTVPDYISWTLTLDGSTVDTADAAALHQQARSLVTDWHPTLRRLVDEADIDATYRFTISTAQPVPPWQSSTVTLLGDAIHTMTPGRGEGANTALRDAGQLREALVDAATNRTPLVEAVARYEKDMLRYGFDAVTNSLQRPFGPPRPNHALS
jgi:2-polyprenyl-6-methoxyphenol hydroxylase-like FAD-dependent oxidoreductase